MIFPQFLALELSSAEDNGFPIAISWSLPDGQLKSVLITPDDEWDPWENSASHGDIQHLYDHGMTGPDVIHEMNEDLDGQTVFVEGLDEDEKFLDLLFETYSNSLGFEIAPITQLYPQMDFESILTLREQISNENQFNLEHLDDRIKALLFLHAHIQDNSNL